jgi:inner membrane protein
MYLYREKNSYFKITMDSLTQIVLGAAVAEAVAGRKMGAKAALWGAIAGTIPDLDVFLTAFFHPIDAALMHRGFSHSMLFALIAGPVLGWLVHRLYKKKYEQKTWIWLFFLGIITHPILDMFTNYGTEFLWPFNYRITFNTVFVIDPLYTVPFMICVLIALFLKRDSYWRSRINWIGIYYSSAYLLWGVIVKLTILSDSKTYFSENGLKTRNAMVTPMPLTSFYWMVLVEDKTNYYVGYKSIFYPFNPNDIDTIAKHKMPLNTLKWPETNYTKRLKFISNGYYTTERCGDTLKFHDLRFGLTSKLTNNRLKLPIMGFGMVIDKGIVKKTLRNRSSNLMKELNFNVYVSKIFNRE